MSIEHKQLISKPKAKSKVWRHFGFPAVANGTIIDKKIIACRLCRAIIAYSGNTSNLTYHLQREHPHEYWELTEEARQSNDKPGLVGQLRDQPLFNETALDTSNSSTLLLILFARACSLYICVVDEPSFRYLLEIAEPRFQLPHRTHFTDKIIPSKYREVRTIV